MARFLEPARRQTPLLALAAAMLVPACIAACLTMPAAAAAPSNAALAEAAERRGDLSTAARLWHGASVTAAEQNDAVARVGALVRLGEVQRELGRLDLALEALHAAVAAATDLESRPLEAAARGARGATRTDVGELPNARDDLDRALELASELDDAALVSAVQNEQGRLAEAEGDSASAAAAYAAAAEAASETGDPLGAFRARANRAYLLARIGDASAPGAFAAGTEAGGSAGEGRVATESWLRLGRTGLLIAARIAAKEDGAAPANRAADCFRHALVLAEASGDLSARARARGGLALVYVRTARYEEARTLTRQALIDADGAGDDALAVGLRVQAGRIARLAGDRDAAIDRLEQAAAAIAADRGLLASPSAFGAGSDELDAVDARALIELVDLLLARAEARKGAEAQADLARAQQALERFKAQELRDYFHDDCVDAYRQRVTDPARASASAAVVYPIPLPDRLALLVSSGDQLEQRTVSVSSEELGEEVRRFRSFLTTRTTRRYVRSARRLHEWIIAPIEPRLRELGVDTLVFVPGGWLRAIPMAALMEGDRHLVERYAIATTPSLQLTEARPVDREKVRIFLGGLSESVDGFPPLPYVPDELSAVQDVFGGKPLLDERFSRDAIRRSLEQHEFGIVHMATHGEFGKTSDESFLLTWDGRLSMTDLAEAVGGFRYRDTPLDLLVLSACETASGGDFAALGLAGVAVQSGARSALGSLWSVQDDATAELLATFYQSLRESGTSRARALQRAQLRLISGRRYSHPAYWAPFLLIGSWL